MVGYDIDGVLCSKLEFDISYFKATGEQRKEINKARETHYKATELVLKPTEEDFVVITSRKPKYASITKLWLHRNGIKPIDIYFMNLSRKRSNMIKYKASIINKLNLDAYYEDDEKIVKSLFKMCPNTSIIRVTPKILTYRVKKPNNSALLF